MYCTVKNVHKFFGAKPELYRENGDRILGHNWDKSLKSFPPSYSRSPQLTDPPLEQVICNWFVMLTLYTEASSLTTLKFMPRNLNDIVRS